MPSWVSLNFVDKESAQDEQRWIFVEQAAGNISCQEQDQPADRSSPDAFGEAAKDGSCDGVRDRVPRARDGCDQVGSLAYDLTDEIRTARGISCQEQDKPIDRNITDVFRKAVLGSSPPRLLRRRYVPVPRRRSDDTFTLLWDLFMVAPWWVCPLTAAVAYVGLAYIAPSLLNRDPILKALGSLSRHFAPWAALLVLIVGVGAALKRWSSGQLLDNQRGSDTINDLTWQEFEEFIGAAYRRKGYRVVENGGGGPDGGIDLVLHGNGEKILVQCKHWRSYRVGVKEVRELHGIIHSKDYAGCRGIFVTFGQYTKEAIQFAKDNNLELIDRAKLIQMIESVQKGSIADVQSSAATQPPHQEKPILPSSPSTPACPFCGNSMVLRTAKQGVHAGNQFWGCSTYPKCHGTKEHV